MSFRARLALIVLLVTSLTGIGVWAFAQAVAQPTPPVVLSGNDVGFRVEGQKRELRTGSNGRPFPVDVVVGQIVVRINGQWVDAQVGGSGTIRPATN
jgi:hypothetical protein